MEEITDFSFLFFSCQLLFKKISKPQSRNPQQGCKERPEFADICIVWFGNFTHQPATHIRVVEGQKVCISSVLSYLGT